MFAVWMTAYPTRLRTHGAHDVALRGVGRNNAQRNVQAEKDEHDGKAKPYDSDDCFYSSHHVSLFLT
jgi:hypothetical protein